MVLRRGDQNSQVTAVQNRLVRLGFMTQAQVSTGPGIFGPRTEAAVTAFYDGLPELWGSVHLAGGFAMAPLESTSLAEARQLFVDATEAVLRVTTTRPCPGEACRI